MSYLSRCGSVTMIRVLPSLRLALDHASSVLSDLAKHTARVAERCRERRGHGRMNSPFDVDLSNGYETRLCNDCGAVVCVPIHFVSEHSEDYVPGHPMNTWGAY